MNLCFAFQLYLCILKVICVIMGDPTEQEIALTSYAMGITFEPCTKALWQNVDSDKFRREFAALLTDYCTTNATYCNLIPQANGASFIGDNVVFLDHYPLLDYRLVIIRFVVVYPQGVFFKKQQKEPLLTKKILSDVLKQNRENLSVALGWVVATYESVPRFDAMTEFMNFALIPLSIAAIALMYGLAYCATSLGNLQNITLVHSGMGSGKERFRDIVLMQQQYFEQSRAFSDTSDESVAGYQGYHKDICPPTTPSPTEDKETENMIREMIKKEHHTAKSKSVFALNKRSKTRENPDIIVSRGSSTSSSEGLVLPPIGTSVKQMATVEEAPEPAPVHSKVPQPEVHAQRKISSTSSHLHPEIGKYSRERRPSTAGRSRKMSAAYAAATPSFLGNLLRPLPVSIPTAIPAGSRPKAVKGSSKRITSGGRKTQTKLFFGGVQGRGGGGSSPARYAKL